MLKKLLAICLSLGLFLLLLSGCTPADRITDTIYGTNIFVKRIGSPTDNVTVGYFHDLYADNLFGVGGNVTAVTGTLPITSTGGATPDIAINYDVATLQVAGGNLGVIPGLYLTAEVDPIFTGSPVFGITGANITNWNDAYGWGNHALAGYLTFETDPVFTLSPAFNITTTNITAWNSCNSSQWITDVSGINYIGSVGIHTTSSATGLLSLYSSDGISNDPVLNVMDNSASAESVGIRVNIAGTKTDYTDGIYITNIATTNMAGADKYGLRIKNSGNWLGVGSANYGLYIETPTGGTTNIAAFIDGVLDMSSNQINNVVDPTLVQDAATKNYVDSVVSGNVSGFVPYTGATSNVSLGSHNLNMSQIAIEPSSTADRAGIYAIDRTADNCTIGFFTEQAVESAIGVASDNRMPIRWNGATYYLLAENSTFRTPLIGTSEPTGGGLVVGQLFFNSGSDTWKKCTSISPVTWETLPSGGATTWGSISGNVSEQLDLSIALGDRELTANKGMANGYAPLDANEKVPVENLGTLPKSPGNLYLRDDQTWATPTTNATWGSIVGTLSSQTDLQGALDSKLSAVTGTALDNVFSSNGLLKRTGVTTYTVDNSTYLTSYTETDPVVKALTGIIKSNGSTISAITDNSSNWNTTYGWGNHASAGYLTAITGTQLDNVFSSTGLLKRTGVNTYTVDSSTYLTGNQNITLSGDLSGSGTTSIASNVTGIQGKAISLATGFLKYSGSAWTFDSSTYLTSNQNISLTGAVTGSGATSIATTLTAAGLDNVFSSNGLLKRTGVATYTLDSSTYLTANQNITLSSDASGSGTTSIAVTNTGLKGVALPTLATGYLYYNGSAWAFQTPAGGTHNLLDGSTHLDTTAGTVVRGDIITGQGSTPKWTKLLKGTANQVLSMDGTGTDIVWTTPVGGSNPSWYGKLYAASADCNPITQTQHQNMLAVLGPTPTGIGITVGRCVQFTPPANITVASIRVFGVGATTNLYKFAIYPVGTGSAKTWDSGTVTTAANTWLNLTTGLPITLTAGTRYWWCVTVVATGTTAGFRSEAAPLGTNFWGAAAAPIGNSTGLGLPVHAQFTVTSPGVFPATLPAVAAAAYSGETTGSVPAGYLDYGGAK